MKDKINPYTTKKRNDEDFKRMIKLKLRADSFFSVSKAMTELHKLFEQLEGVDLSNPELTDPLKESIRKQLLMSKKMYADLGVLVSHQYQINDIIFGDGDNGEVLIVKDGKIQNIKFANSKEINFGELRSIIKKQEQEVRNDK